VPRELAPQLHELLRRHFVEPPGVEVIVERRGVDRRSDDERRIRVVGHREERRRIRSVTGRRVAERRAPLVAVEAPALPRRAQRFGQHLLFVERLEPSTRQAEDVDTARLVVQIQGGERDAFAILYMRYFDRVYSYLKIVFRNDPHAAEEAAQEVFTRVLAALPGYERREQPFRAWLFTIVRNHVLSQLDKQRRFAPTDPALLDSWREGQDESTLDPASLDAITDRELLLFVERLPLFQRQVLLLRFMVGFRHREVAAILGRTESDVSVAQSRALRYLRERLTAIGRASREPQRPAHMRRPLVKARVLRRRRSALLHYN
jgi:RNA polymerase sigma-70 factor (ECF subfamily)